MTRSLTLIATVLLLTSHAVAEQPPAARQQALLLDSGACAAQDVAMLSPAFQPAKASDLEGGNPEPLWMEHCNATQECSDGSQVSCTGHQSCTVQSDSVTCDGVTHQCAQCTAPANCIDPEAYCACLSYSSAFQCWRQYCTNCSPFSHACEPL